jgi:inorganic triphosphatase YgiF
VETELKLLLAPLDLGRLRRDPRIKALQQGRASTRRVRSVYYDTPERALLRAGLALRLRADGGRWLQTLKTEGQATAGLHLREEWEWPLPGAALDFGLLATTPEAKLFRAAGLRAALGPAFTTDFERTSLRLGFADGSLAELCLDSGEIRSGRRASAISEAEIELLAGSPARLYELALELVERVPLRLGQASKAERGYALTRKEPARPVKAARLELDPQGSVAAAFATVVRGCMAHLQANEAGFLAGKDPEYLHQVRVALRRLRACFSLFRTVIPEPVFAPLLHQLRQQSTALGRARDWDVFVHGTLRALRSQRADEAAVAAFERRCAKLGRAHLRAAQGAVASAAWQRLWLELGRLLSEGAWIEGHAALALRLGGFAADLLQQRAATLKKRGKRLQELDAAGRHRVRIAAKKLRYAAEFFAALFPKRRVRPYLQSLAAMQEVLGGLNDAATLLRLLPEALAGARAPDARVAGMIQGWSAASTHLQLARLGRGWDHWQRQKPFWKSAHAFSERGSHV